MFSAQNLVDSVVTHSKENQTPITPHFRAWLKNKGFILPENVTKRQARKFLQAFPMYKETKK